MSLFVDIQSDLISQTDLSVVLRKAKVLAYKLGNQEFKDWVENELNGYPNDEDLPQYRKLPTMAFGNFFNGAWHITNHPIPLLNVPENFRRIFSELNVFQGIKQLESMLVSAQQSGEESLRIAVPYDIAGLLHYKVFDNLQCTGAWRIFNTAQIVQVLETTRNALLSFILELSDEYPEIKSDASIVTEISDEKVAQIFNYFIWGGAQNIAASATNVQGGNMTLFDQRNQHVNTQYNAAGDINFANVESAMDFVAELQKLKAELSRIAAEEAIDGEIITDADYQLTKAIQQAEKDTPDKSAVIEHLEHAKGYIDGITSLVKLATAIGGAIAVATTIF